MSKRSPYRRHDEEFRRNAVQLVLEGRPLSEVADQLGISYATLARWRLQQCAASGLPVPQPSKAANPPPEPSAQQVQELRRRLAYVERERDILKKALAICSRDPELKNGSN